MELTIALILLVMLGVFWLWGGLRHLFRRPLGGFMRLCSGGACLALAAATWMAAMNLHTYHRLTAEREVARLSFEQLGPQIFQASVEFPDGMIERHLLRGDDWQLDARILKWKGIATLLGMDSRYRLERLSGRYRAIEQERQQLRTVIELAPPQGLTQSVDVWAMADAHPRWLPLIDAIYGNAAYLPMKDGAIYQVSVTSSGLIARQENGKL